MAVIGVFYGLTGALMAWAIRFFFWVPHRFRYGILAAGFWGNSGDMRMCTLQLTDRPFQLNFILHLAAAVALSITASAPFNDVDDQNLAIAYMSMFIFVFFVRPLPGVLFRADSDTLKITLFALGGYHIVAKDFQGPDVSSEELRDQMYLRRRRMATNGALLLSRLLRLSQHPNAREKCDVEEGGDLEKNDIASSNGSVGSDEGLDQNKITGTTITPVPTVVVSSRTPSTLELPKQPAGRPSSHCHYHGLLSRSRHFLEQLLKPCTIVILLSFVVSLVDPLKALFIPPSSNFQPHFRPTAPGGQPPLAFIYNTTTFIGGACIPLGLICLGSALTSLSLRYGGPFPKGAIVSLALGRMVVNPIIGVAITRGFVHVGFVDRDDKVLQFVCMCVV